MEGPPPGPGDRERPIPTPDQRLRVFISSTMVELAAERAAVRDAVTRLRLIPVLFELSARSHPPRDLYRAYLAQSDVFVGIYGDTYGWVAPGMEVSGLEDEYDLSAGLPRLLYVRRSAERREPRLVELIDRMQREGGVSTIGYDDPAELSERVSDDLAVLLSERFAVRAPPGLAPGRLPTPTARLVDRRDELRLVTDLLRDPAVRLVTITGPGGTGKSRLALAAAEELVPARDAVWWVDLSAVQDPAAVPRAVAAAVGVAPEGSRPVLDLVAARLGARRALLVIDNAEQLLAAAPELGRLLSRVAGTQLLVTSRSVLRLRGEQDVPLGPLAVPDAGASHDVVTAAPAVQLFSARARRADPSFTVTAATAPAVAEVVRRLDGLPLALELAAARVRTLPPPALLRRLSSALDPVLDLPGPEVDAPDRQRTLRATIQWSHDLLTEAERALLARLSVCASGCTLDTAEHIGAVDGDIDVVETLSALVAHSLVASTDTGEGEPRFRMLGLVRVFAAERLRERGEEDRTRLRLADHLARVSGAAGAGLLGPDHLLWRTRLDAETVDLLAALHWAVEHDRADLVVRIAAPLARWWWSCGLVVPMAEIADRTARLSSTAGLPAEDRARLQWARGIARIARGRAGDAVPLLEAVADEARSRDDPWLLGHALTGLAIARPPEDPGLPDLLAEAVAALRSSGDTWSVAYALAPLGDAALQAGDRAAAARAHEEALGLARRTGDDLLVAAVLDRLGMDAVLSGDLGAARDRLTESAGLHRQVRDQEGLANCLDGLSALVLALGVPRAAARLAGAADAARATLGVAVWPLRRSQVERLAERIRAALGADDEPRERAAGAAAGPWGALDAGLAAVAAAEEVAVRPRSSGDGHPVRTANRSRGRRHEQAGTAGRR